MNVVHRITGYDKGSERLEFEFDVPAERMLEVRRIAHVDPEDVEAAGSYPLDLEATRVVSGYLGLPMHVEKYVWFFEPFAV